MPVESYFLIFADIARSLRGWTCLLYVSIETRCRRGFSPDGTSLLDSGDVSVWESAKNWEKSTETDYLIRNTVLIVRWKKRKKFLSKMETWLNICIRIYFYSILFSWKAQTCMYQNTPQINTPGLKLLNLILRRYIDEISSLTITVYQRKTDSV